MNPRLKEEGMEYQRAMQSYRKTEVETADQLRLIILCYEATIKEIRQAKAAYENGEFARKAQHLTKAGNIIAELSSSLNREQGGIIANNLSSLYTYMLRRLVEGDVRSDLTAFDEVAHMLSELMETWKEISTSGKVKSQLPSAHNATTGVVSGVAV